MLKRLILALLMATPAMAQTSFYTDRALQQVNVLTSPTPLTAAIPYGPVRVCSLPLTQQSPCLPLATITDINGNPVSNSIGPLFGQLTTDATGRFTFGCTLGNNYQVQVTQSASNTPAVNYPITCPGVGANPQFGSLTLSGPGVTTFNAGITSIGVNTFTNPASFQGLLDWNSCTMNTWSDPNGSGPGVAANRQACYRFRQTNAVANDATSVANGVFYFGGQLTCLSGAECHHFLAYPIIVRGTGGNFKDVLTGGSFSAPVAPSGDASTTTAGIAASWSFESNPPSSWVTLGCAGCLNTFQTAQTNLGQNTFNVLIKSGGLALGSAINLLAAGNGIRQGVGDMEINNFDTTAAGTITFYNGGSNKSRMANTGAWTHTNTATWNYSVPTINLNGTEGSARNWSISESAGSFIVTDVSSGAARLVIQSPGNNALVDAVNGYGLGASGTAVLISATAPTIAAAGCGGAAAAIVVSNGTGAFKINVGTTPTSACTFTMPAATTGWNVSCTDITTNSTSVFLQKQTGAESQTSVTITNFNDVAVATAFVASDILKCTASAD